MKRWVFSKQQIENASQASGVKTLSEASIAQVVSIVQHIESNSSTKFIRMELGIPGMSAYEQGCKAEIKAIERGLSGVYPPAVGLTDLKRECSRFIEAFIDTKIQPHCCTPTVGSVGGLFGIFTLLRQLDKRKDTVLFIDPGFPVQKTQAAVTELKQKHFDMYDYRGDKMREKIDSILSQGDISAIIYSNPNNPAWTCLTEQELQIIGECATKYDTIVIEDLAYLCMDFRRDLSHPFRQPYQPTISKYTDNYIIMISASKIFSYAGGRLAMVCVSDKLAKREYLELKSRYGVGEFNGVLTNIILYCMNSGVSHTTQYALAEMFRAACDGEIDFVSDCKDYQYRAQRMKKIFTDNGFHIVYDKDCDEAVGDGFFFTLGYKNLSGGELMERLLYYGISSISLSTTGSSRDGIRACTSNMKEALYPVLEERVKLFSANE